MIVKKTPKKELVGDIEKNIPYVFLTRRPKSPVTEQIELLNIGDSFLTNNVVSDASARATASRLGKKLDRKFLTSATKKGFRVWRIA